MAMRHKPIQPRKKPPVKGKRRGAGQHHVHLTQDQQDALTQFQKDFRKAYPAIVETTAVAQKLFQELIDQPEWRIAEAEMPPGVAKPDTEKVWSVGHAKVNYVDHIERKGDTR
jgi:hypothetical protein